MAGSSNTSSPRRRRSTAALLSRPRAGVPRRVRALSILGLTLAASFLALWLQRVDVSVRAVPPLAPTPPYNERLAQLGSGESVDLAAVAVPVPIRVAPGKTPSMLLADLGLAGNELQAAVTALGEKIDLRRLRAGEEGEAYYDGDRHLASMELRLRGKGRVELVRDDRGWESEWHEIERSTHVQRVEGELTDFLESSLVRAGGLPQLGVAMSLVLQWDLDFNRDLQPGDRFDVLYEEVWLDGERAEVGDILALSYETRGRELVAYRHPERGRGYYDAEGRPLQRMFLRSPLPFTRITSRFTNRRFHPVLKVYRPHYGIDLGAPTGTPVRSTASGTVIYAGRKRQTGKMVKVRHANGYVTAYLHLSGFAKGLHVGDRVSQGELIGYVGSTGLATAPHLDYRVQKNGRWINPLSLKSKPAPPIPPTELADFTAWRDLLRQSLAGEEGPEQEVQRIVTAESQRAAEEDAASSPSTAVAR